MMRLFVRVGALRFLVGVVLGFLLFVAPVAAQNLTVTPSDAALTLANTLVGDGLTLVDYALYAENVVAAGYISPYDEAGVTNATGTYVNGPLGLSDGVLLTNGDAKLAEPPNRATPGTGDGATGVHGNSPADDTTLALCRSLGIVNENIKDPVRLHLVVSFSAEANGISVDYVFGAEDYRDNLGSDTVDGAGIFLSMDIEENYTNITLDGAAEPLTVNSAWMTPGTVVETFGGSPEITEYNGLTPRIHQEAFIDTNAVTYVSVEFVICDGTGDQYWDAGLFVANLQACVGTCNETTYCSDGEVQAAQGEECDDGNVINGDGCDSSCAAEHTFPWFMFLPANSNHR